MKHSKAARDIVGMPAESARLNLSLSLLKVVAHLEHRLGKEPVYYRKSGDDVKESTSQSLFILQETTRNNVGGWLSLQLG